MATAANSLLGAVFRLSPTAQRELGTRATVAVISGVQKGVYTLSLPTGKKKFSITKILSLFRAQHMFLVDDRFLRNRGLMVNALGELALLPSNLKIRKKSNERTRLVGTSFKLEPRAQQVLRTAAGVATVIDFDEERETFELSTPGGKQKRINSQTLLDLQNNNDIVPVDEKYLSERGLFVLNDILVEYRLETDKHLLRIVDDALVERLGGRVGKPIETDRGLIVETATKKLKIKRDYVTKGKILVVQPGENRENALRIIQAEHAMQAKTGRLGLLRKRKTRTLTNVVKATKPTKRQQKLERDIKDTKERMENRLFRIQRERETLMTAKAKSPAKSRPPGKTSNENLEALGPLVPVPANLQNVMAKLQEIKNEINVKSNLVAEQKKDEQMLQTLKDDLKKIKGRVARRKVPTDVNVTNARERISDLITKRDKNAILRVYNVLVAKAKADAAKVAAKGREQTFARAKAKQNVLRRERNALAEMNFNSNIFKNELLSELERSIRKADLDMENIVVKTHIRGPKPKTQFGQLKQYERALKLREAQAKTKERKRELEREIAQTGEALEKIKKNKDNLPARVFNDSKANQAAEFSLQGDEERENEVGKHFALATQQRATQTRKLLQATQRATTNAEQQLAAKKHALRTLPTLTKRDQRLRLRLLDLASMHPQLFVIDRGGLYLSDVAQQYIMRKRREYLGDDAEYVASPVRALARRTTQTTRPLPYRLNAPVELEYRATAANALRKRLGDADVAIGAAPGGVAKVRRLLDLMGVRTGKPVGATLRGEPLADAVELLELLPDMQGKRIAAYINNAAKSIRPVGVQMAAKRDYIAKFYKDVRLPKSLSRRIDENSSNNSERKAKKNSALAMRRDEMLRNSLATAFLRALSFKLCGCVLSDPQVSITKRLATEGCTRVRSKLDCTKMDEIGLFKSVSRLRDVVSHPIVHLKDANIEKFYGLENLQSVCIAYEKVRVEIRKKVLPQLGKGLQDMARQLQLSIFQLNPAYIESHDVNVHPNAARNVSEADRSAASLARHFMELLVIGCDEAIDELLNDDTLRLSNTKQTVDLSKVPVINANRLGAGVVGDILKRQTGHVKAHRDERESLPRNDFLNKSKTSAFGILMHVHTMYGPLPVGDGAYYLTGVGNTINDLFISDSFFSPPPNASHANKDEILKKAMYALYRASLFCDAVYGVRSPRLAPNGNKKTFEYVLNLIIEGNFEHADRFKLSNGASAFVYVFQQLQAVARHVIRGETIGRFLTQFAQAYKPGNIAEGSAIRYNSKLCRFMFENNGMRDALKLITGRISLPVFIANPEITNLFSKAAALHYVVTSGMKVKAEYSPAYVTKTSVRRIQPLQRTVLRLESKIKETNNAATKADLISTLATETAKLRAAESLAEHFISWRDRLAALVPPNAIDIGDTDAMQQALQRMLDFCKNSSLVAAGVQNVTIEYSGIGKRVTRTSNNKIVFYKDAPKPFSKMGREERATWLQSALKIHAMLPSNAKSCDTESGNKNARVASGLSASQCLFTKLSKTSPQLYIPRSLNESFNGNASVRLPERSRSKERSQAPKVAPVATVRPLQRSRSREGPLAPKVAHRATVRPLQRSRSMEGSWTILRTARNGRCALHAVSQVLCRMDVSGIENSTLRNIKNYYKHPELAKRINDLVRTGEFIVNDFNVSNPSIYKDYIMERLRWVKRVVTLVEETLRDNVRGDRLTTTSLIQAAQSQGYRGVDIQAIQNEEAVIFILQENPANPGTNHWIAAIPATRT